MKKTIKLTIFWIAISFIVITIFSLTLGQILPYEFADNRIMHSFYDIIMQGLPIAVLLSLFGTVRKVNSKTKNWTFVGLTVLISILSFFLILNLIFKIGFGAWTTETILYRHKTENKEIKEQLFDVGAFGYDGQRIVETKPFLKYWISVTNIDTTSMDKDQWEYINKQGDIKFP